MRQSATKALTVRVFRPMADKVDQMASRLKRSHSWVVEQALPEWISRGRG